METKICNKCGLEKDLELFKKDKRSKDGRGASCKECGKESKRISDKKYYEKNKKACNERSKEWKDNNEEKVRGHKRKYQDNNKESIFIRGKEYREENKEKLNKRKRDYYENNPDKKIEKNKKHAEWKKGVGLESTRTASQKRRALKITTDDGTITVKSKAELMFMQFNKCNECGCCLIKNEYHLDHVIPISKGGIHSIHNVQYLCINCNLSKGDR